MTTTADRLAGVAPAAATGVGSLPGIDVLEMVRLVLGELPDLPHLPELPARGPGADMLGRTAAQLVDLHVDLQPSGWRLVDRPGLDERRATSWMDQDLDALEELAGDLRGPLKLSLAGPWTLAAGVELPRGDKALSDSGACRDLTESLAEAAATHVAAVRRRLPGADVVLQLDEPSLPGVLAGSVPSASGWDRLRAVPEHVVEEALRRVVDAAGVPVVVHCCADTPPVELIAHSGAAALSIDAVLLRLGRPGPLDDALGSAVEAGLRLVLGVVTVAGGAVPSVPAATVAPVRALWRRLGFESGLLPDRVVFTPTCGLAAADPGGARAAMAACRAAGQRLRDDPEG